MDHLDIQDRSEADLTQPEILSAQCLLNILKQRGVATKHREKSQLVGLYYRTVLPLPQRTHRENRRGQQMAAQQTTEESRKRIHFDSTVVTEPPVKKGSQLLSSYTVTPSPSRLKPPPSAVNFDHKVMSLTTATGAAGLSTHRRSEQGTSDGGASSVVIRSRPSGATAVCSAEGRPVPAPSSARSEAHLTVQPAPSADVRSTLPRDSQKSALDFEIRSYRPRPKSAATSTIATPTGCTEPAALHKRVKLCRSVKLPSPVAAPDSNNAAKSPPAVQPTAKSPPAVQPTAKSPPAVQPTAKSPPAVQPTAKSPPAVQPTAKSPPAVQPTAKSPPAVQPTAKSPPAVQPTAKSPPAVQPTAKSPPAVQPTAKSPPAVQPTAKSPPAVQPTAKSPLAVQPTRIGCVATANTAQGDSPAVTTDCGLNDSTGETQAAAFIKCKEAKPVSNGVPRGTRRRRTIDLINKTLTERAESDSQEQRSVEQKAHPPHQVVSAQKQVDDEATCKKRKTAAITWP